MPDRYTATLDDSSCTITRLESLLVSRRPRSASKRRLWAVISVATDRERAARATRAAEEQLIDTTAGLIGLVAPPFNRTTQDPGYVKGYVPGIRENGGP